MKILIFEIEDSVPDIPRELLSTVRVPCHYMEKGVTLKSIES